MYLLQVNTKRGPPMVTKNNFWYLSIGLVLTYFFFKSNKKYIILSLFLSCLPEVSQTSIPLDSSTSTLPRYLTAKLHRPARTLSSSLSNLDDFFLVVFFDFFLPKFKDFLRDDDNCYSVKFFEMCRSFRRRRRTRKSFIIYKRRRDTKYTVVWKLIEKKKVTTFKIHGSHPRKQRTRGIFHNRHYLRRPTLLLLTQYSSKENFGVGCCNLSAINARTRGIYIAEPDQ